MDTTPTLFGSDPEHLTTQQVLLAPFPDSLDLFDVADLCCAFASVLLETDDRIGKLALCGRLAHALEKLEERCDSDLPEHLVTALTAEVLTPPAVPDCWYESSCLMGYTRALTATLTVNVLDAKTEAELAGLLHDLVYLLAEQIKTPCWVRES